MTEETITIEDCECIIEQRIRIDNEADLLCVHFEASAPDEVSCDFSAVQYRESGLIITVWDWQGDNPQTVEEIPEYTWRCGDIPCVILNGKPYCLPIFS